MPKAPLADRIDQGRGLVPADLVLKGGRVFDLITGDLVETDVAICGDTIVGVFGSYQGKREIDVSGRVLVPGFIDTHLHVESSLVTPHEFDRCVTPRGVTTAICDPHEIANVCGIKGIRYFLESAPQLVMDLRVQLSSCVPSTHMETTGARLSAADLVPFMDHPKVIGLAEFMNSASPMTLGWSMNGTRSAATSRAPVVSMWVEGTQDDSCTRRSMTS